MTKQMKILKTFAYLLVISLFAYILIETDFNLIFILLLAPSFFLINFIFKTR